MPVVELRVNFFLRARAVFLFRQNYIAKVSLASFGKLSRMELYIRSLSHKKLKLQWKKNSNEDYFRTTGSYTLTTKKGQHVQGRERERERGVQRSRVPEVA